MARLLAALFLFLTLPVAAEGFFNPIARGKVATASGRYSPTITMGVFGSVAYIGGSFATWSQTGDVFTVAGHFEAKITLPQVGVLFRVHLSPPVPGVLVLCGGTVAIMESTYGEAGVVFADTSNNTIAVQIAPGAQTEDLRTYIYHATCSL